jgi:RNA polymerase sigma factor for flagellar operon FliA
MPAAATGHPSAPQIDEEQIVLDNLPLVDYEVATLRRRLPSHVRQDGLVAAGMAALALAARSFDPEQRVPFARYAARRISGALLDELRSHDWASRSVRRRSREQEGVAHELGALSGRAATTEEVAEPMGVSVRDLETNQRDVQRSVVLSFQAVVDAGAVDTMLPSAEPIPQKVLLDRERQAYLHDAVALLPERSRTVVIGVFFEERPMQDLAAELGVSESRVSQMRAEAMQLLRAALDARLAPENATAEERPDSRVARRREAYYAALAARSSYKARLSVPRPPATDLVAATG